MKRTEFILDEMYPASENLERLLNEGYEVISSHFLSPDNERVFYAAMLVKEEQA